MKIVLSYVEFIWRSKQKMYHFSIAVFFAYSLFVFALPLAAADKPQHIVSVNVCTDQLLMLLVSRDRIASVSYFAVDPMMSAMAEQAIGLPLNHGMAEEILSLQPDLVLASAYSTRPTVYLLRKLGLPVTELPIATTMDDIRSNIRTLAKALHETKRGEVLIEQFDDTLGDVNMTLGDHKPLAGFYWANSMTSGRNSLANTVLHSAGYDNLAAQLGIMGTGFLSLEILIKTKPDLLVMGQPRRDHPALADMATLHPVIDKTFPKQTIRISDALWVCGTPFVAIVVKRLAALRTTLQ